MARRDLGNRASPVDLNQMKRLLKCPNFKFRISYYMIIIFFIASPETFVTQYVFSVETYEPIAAIFSWQIFLFSTPLQDKLLGFVLIHFS